VNSGFCKHLLKFRPDVTGTAHHVEGQLDHPKHQGFWAAWTRRFWFSKWVKMNKPGWEKDGVFESIFSHRLPRL